MTTRKSARFHVGRCCSPYPSHYRKAFAFSAILCPQDHQRSLRFACRCRQPFGLTLFRMNLRAGRTLPFRRRWFVHDGLSIRSQSSSRTFWFKPVSTFGLFKITTFKWKFTYVGRTHSSLAPLRRRAGRFRFASRLGVPIPRRLHCPQSFTPSRYRLRMSG